MSSRVGPAGVVPRRRRCNVHSRVIACSTSCRCPVPNRTPSCTRPYLICIQIRSVQQQLELYRWPIPNRSPQLNRSKCAGSTHYRDMQHSIACNAQLIIYVLFLAWSALLAIRGMMLLCKCGFDALTQPCDCCAPMATEYAVVGISAPVGIALAIVIFLELECDE